MSDDPGSAADVGWARDLVRKYAERGGGLDRQDFRFLPTPSTGLGPARNNPVELIRVEYAAPRTIRFGLFSNRLVSVRVQLGFPYGTVTFRGDVPGVPALDTDGTFAFATLTSAVNQIHIVVAQSLRVFVLPTANVGVADRVCGFVAPDQPDVTEQLLDRLYQMLGSGAVFSGGAEYFDRALREHDLRVRALIGAALRRFGVR